MSQGTFADPVRILLYGFNQRNESMMRQLFRGARWRDCTVVDDASADFAIVDLDGPSPEKIWSAFRKAFPTLFALVVSMQLRHKDNALFLQKPLSMERLRTSVDEIKTYLKQENSQTPTDKVETTDAPALTALDAAHTLATEEDSHLFGDKTEVSFDDKVALGTRMFDPEKYLYGELSKAIEQSRATGKPLEISGSLYGRVLPGAIRILPQENLVEHTLRDIMIRAMSIVRLDSGQLVLQTKEAFAPLQGSVTVNLDAFLWEVAVATSRGRLSKALRMHEPLTLQHWPNMTQYLEVPYSLQISSLLVSSAYTAQELCEQFGIPQRFVFSYLSALNAIGILVSGSSNKSSHTVNDKRPLRRFFNRILERLSLDTAS